jgi:hypothetical protein
MTPLLNTAFQLGFAFAFFGWIYLVGLALAALLFLRRRKALGSAVAGANALPFIAVLALQTGSKLGLNGTEFGMTQQLLSFLLGAVLWVGPVLSFGALLHVLSRVLIRMLRTVSHAHS